MPTTTPIPNDFGTATMFFRNAAVPREMATTVAFKCVALVIPTPNQMAASVRGAFATASGAPFKAEDMLTGWSLNRVEVYFRNSDGDLLQGSQNTPVNGSKSGSGLIVNCSLKVNKQTALAGRKFRGRFYAPPTYLVEGDLGVNGEISSGNQISLQSMWSSAFAAMNAEELRPVLLHSWAGIPAPNPPDPTDIEAFVVQSKVGTIGRRMRF